MHDELSQKKCRPCEGDVEPMTTTEIDAHLQEIANWTFTDGTIARTFAFKNYYQTVAFVNAIAWIAHTEDHHPDIEFGYKTCTIRYVTHSIGGISENDFICAAKINMLVRG